MTSVDESERREPSAKAVEDDGAAGIPMALLETLLQHAPAGFGFVDRAFRFVRVNDVLSLFHAVPAAAHFGRPVHEVVPHLWPALEPLYLRALAGETVLDQDFSSGATSTGEVRHWSLSHYPVLIQGKVIGIGVIAADITARRRAEDALRARNDLYAMLALTNRAVSRCHSSAELFTELCAVAVETGRFRFAWVGAREGDLVKRVASAGDDGGYLSEAVISLDESDPRSHGPTGRCFVTGESFVVNDFATSTMMLPWRELAGRVGVGATAAFPLKEQGQVVAVLILCAGVPGFFTPDLVTTLSDITPSVSFALDGFVQQRERRRDEADLRLRDRAIRAVSQGIVITDYRLPDQPILYASPGFERMTGYAAEHVVGRNCRFLQGKDTDPRPVAELREAVREARRCTVELLNYRKDGTPFRNHMTISPVMDPSGQVTNFVGVLTDVTELRQLESQLRQAQKMEAIGQLAAGVAHDFNNLLSVILSYTDLVLDDLAPGVALRDDLEQVRRAGERATDLTQQLLAFSRRQVLEPRVLDLGQLVLGMERMLRPLLGAGVELSLLRAPELGKVVADPVQVEQIVMNLSVNARDAMSPGGKLTIETANAELDAGYAADNPGVVPGPYVMLAISDSGTGMDAATRERVFEPFFTTKAQGKGTGLGLSTVFGIVKQSRGHIEVRSEPDRGTTFRVFLPRTDQGIELSPSSRAAPASGRGTETVLLVEDDEQVRAVTRSILQRHGYTVLDAQNGGEAFLICEQQREKIHLLLTDVVMPRMSGRLLAERLVALRPEMKVLFMSGYTENAVLHEGVIDAGIAFLHKPITPHALLRKLREVLDETPGPGAGTDTAPAAEPGLPLRP